MNQKIKTIYLAGKITGDNWRDEIVGKGIWHCPKTTEQKYQVPCVVHGAIFGVYDYTGPFMVETMVQIREELTPVIDYYHRFSKAEDSIGAKKFAEELHGVGSDIEPEANHGEPFQTQVDRHAIITNCFSGIAKANLVFCWIDRTDIFGTLAEIGYAKSLGCQIWIAGPRRMEKMWFVYEMANKTMFGDITPAQALRDMLGYVDHAAYIKSEAWRVKADAAKQRAGHRCQVCNKSGQLDAHHRTYERLGNELPEDITVLCRECHELYEKNRMMGGQ
jgi:hypothetical protein